MLKQRNENIVSVLKRFKGTGGEPRAGAEFYILKSMWVMMLSEFEGSIKDIVEAYLDKMRTTPIEKVNICLLLQNFHPSSEEVLSIDKILNIYKKNSSEITYSHFTRDKKPKYKFSAIEKLFNTLGIFFSDQEITTLKILNSIASTRDAIAHGDKQIQITKKELMDRLADIENIYDLLKKKLS